MPTPIKKSHKTKHIFYFQETLRYSGYQISNLSEKNCV